MLKPMRYVVVTGGVLSGLGKGVTASSIGVLLKSLDLHVTAIKIDPYLNTDAGTMSPFEHGEVFVLDDGGEVDLDLGNYERFLDVTLGRDNNLTTGKIYSEATRQNEKEIIWARPFKPYRISQMQYRIGYQKSHAGLSQILARPLTSASSNLEGP